MPTRKLEIELIGDSSSLSKSFRGAVRDADTFGSRLRHAGVMGAKVLGGALVAGAAAGTYAIVKSAEAAEEANKVHAQTGAVLKSTGHAAGVSQKQVENLAESIMRKTGIDDEAILTGQNLLLTFKNIKNEAGAGNNVFDQATHAMVDMSAAMGNDASSSAIQLGKALNDPIKGISALSKVGVSFSDQQKEQIEQWVESGETLRAQKAILKELNSEFGGSAVAQATAMEKIKTSIGNVEESVGNVFLPIIDQAATKLNREFVPELQHTADGLARIAARKNIDMGEKLGLAEDLVKRQWGDVPEQIGHLVDEAVPIVAERAGQLGVAAAKGMVHGFIHADPLGKAAILLFASKAFGGPAALIGAGKAAGSKLGGAAATESAAAMAAGFGLSSRGGKAFGLVDRFRSIGSTAGKLGLGLGLLEGASAMLSNPASTLGPVLEEYEQYGSGMVGTLQRVTHADDLFGAVGIDSWAGQGDAAKRLKEILDSINTVHGKQNRLLASEARSLEDQLNLTQEQRAEAEKTLRAQTIAGQTLKSGIGGLEGGKFTRLKDIRTVVAEDAKAIATTYEQGSQSARNAAARNYNAAAEAIEVGMRRGVISTKTGMEQIRRYTREAHLVSGDDPWGIAKGFSRTWDKAGAITKQNLNRITQDLGKMPEPAARATAQMMLGMAREMRSKGQLTKGEVERLRSAVVTKLGLMATQAGKKGEAFRTNLGAPIGGLSIDVAEALENIGVNVGDLLEKMGADNPLMGFTMNYFKGHGGGGKGGKYLDKVAPLNEKARGGAVRVPGQGLQDTVPLAVNNTLSARVAPGEDLVVFNRHQRPMIDRALANEYGVAGLPGFFDNFDRPHYLAKGGFAEPRIGGPDPLRGGAQAGIHKGYRAAQEYLKAHRPKPSPGGGGVAGYTGPPANMKQLGDNAWVDSHTLAVAAYLSQKFGIGISSSYRTPQHNAEVGGVANSFHTHGSMANPGAIDFVPPSSAALSFAQSHIAGLEEAMIHDVGSGLHLHLAFFDKGGMVDAGRKFAGGGVVTGKVSYFGGGATAGGSTTSAPGVALNLDPGNEPGGWNNDTTQGWMSDSNAGHPVFAKVTIGGKTANLPITDLGPASWTGRSIDVTEGGVRKLGLDPGAFPTDTIGKAVILDGSGGKKGKTSSGKPKFHPHPGKTGKGGGTEGPGGKYPKGTRKTHGESLPGMEPSPALPSASALPQSIQNLLTAPGMTYAGRTAIGELALQQAGRTEGTEDDRAAYNFQEELLKRKKERLQKRLAEVRAKLKKRHSKAEETKLLAQQGHILSELGSTESGLSSVREGRAGLDDEAEEAEDAALKVAEEQKQATEELKASMDALSKEIAQQNAIASSELAIGLREAKRFLADMITGQVGPEVSQASLAVGIGKVGSS
jgi:Peptidase M15/Prophage tail length tape measure protein